MLLLVALLGCSPSSEPGDVDDVTKPLAEPAPLAELSDGECPDLSGPGTKTFMSGGYERTVDVVFPTDGVQPGMPVLFGFHGTGDNASNFKRAMGFQSLANAHGAVVIVPTALSQNLIVEWSFMNDGAGDVELFDDMRTCLSRDLDVDLSRIYATGFSAGSLWSTYLSMHRSEQLATVFLMSGGTGEVVDYVSPVEDIPVMMLWGGESDTWGGAGINVDFNEATLEYSSAMVAEEHLVVMCNHELGHSAPSNAVSMMETWLFDHAFGVPSPYRDGDLSSFPDYCFVATGS